MLILGSVPFLMVLGNSMIIPEFTTIGKALNISQLQVGLMVTWFSVPAALFIPLAGFLSDRIGRKNIIVPGLFLYGLGGAAAGFATVLFPEPYYFILAGRAMQGMGAAGTPVAMALAGDLFKTKERSESMGIFEAANGAGKMLSPIIGAAVALIAWQALFFTYAFFTIPAALLIRYAVKEPEKVLTRKSLKEYAGGLALIIKKKGVSILVSFSGGMAVLMIIFGVLSFSANIITTRFGVEGLYRGLILSYPMLSLSVTSYLTGYYLKKGKGFRSVYLAGLIIVSLSLIILPLCCHSLLMYPVMLGLLGIGSGLVLPVVNTMVTSAAPKEHRGTVTSFYSSIRFIGVALGPPLFALLHPLGIDYMFSAAALLSLIAAGLGLLLFKEDAVFG